MTTLAPTQNATRPPVESAAARAEDRPRRVYAALVGVAAALVLLQGLWAGMFMSKPGTDPQQTPWLEVHSWGGKFAILFASLAAEWAFLKLKARKDLLVGAGALAVVLALVLVLVLVLVLESYIGGLIVDEGKDVMTAVHVPLAMAVMGLAVWLPLRARTGRLR